MVLLTGNSSDRNVERVMVDMRIISNEEYRQGLRKEIEENGLKKSVEKRCDDIFDICSEMRYVPCMTVSEWLCEILDLIEENDGKDI